MSEEKYNSLCQKVNEEFVGNFYNDTNRTITSSMRAKIIEMLFKETYHSSDFIIDKIVQLFDHFLFINPQFSPDHLQKLAYICHVLVTKMEIRNDIFDCEERLLFSQEEIHEFEINVWHQLNHKIHFVTTIEILNLYLFHFNISLPPSVYHQIIQPFLFATIISSRYMDIKQYHLALCVLYYLIDHHEIIEKQHINEFERYQILQMIQNDCNLMNLNINEIIFCSNEIKEYMNYLVNEGIYPNDLIVQQ